MSAAATAALIILGSLVLSASAQPCQASWCTTGGASYSCNAAAYANTAAAVLTYPICCMPSTKGASTTYGDGTGCMLDPCAAATSLQACMSLKYCVPIPYISTSAPSLQCVHQEKLCWTMNTKSLCSANKFCVWSATTSSCLWGLTSASTPVPVAAANTCPTINIFVLIMLIFMFVSLVAAIVTVAVVVVVNQKKAEREALEEEEAAAAGGRHEL